eukprot:COSAG02_NODE_5298_length_4461_cov_2.071068_4_plen_275_part_00
MRNVTPRRACVPRASRRASRRRGTRTNPQQMAESLEPEPVALNESMLSTVRELRQVAEQHGSCDEAAREDELQTLVSSLRAERSGQDPSPSTAGVGATRRRAGCSTGAEDRGPELASSSSLLVKQPAVPPTLASLWLESRTWHFSQGHCDVFGFNIFSPDSVKTVTVQIFGDLECRDDWLEHMRECQPEQPSVAERGWLCIASLSEYDFLFSCFDSSSPNFGHVRHMVNNCCEEWACCDDASVLVQRLLLWNAKGADQVALFECSPRPPPPSSR